MHRMMNEQATVAPRNEMRCLATSDLLECNSNSEEVANVKDALHSAGFSVTSCEDVRRIQDELVRGADALVVTERQLREYAQHFTEALAGQAAATAFPTIVILTESGSDDARAGTIKQLLALLHRHGPVFFVPSPIRRDVLQLTAQSAASARSALRESVSLKQHVTRVQQEVENRIASALSGNDEWPSDTVQHASHGERFASMGTLAAGLGHDLGNLVFPLRIRVDLMRSRDVCPELREDLNAIFNAVQYLQRLANGLRHMAMDPSETGIGVESVDLNEWWADVEPLLRNALSRGIKLEQRFEAGLPRIPVAAHGLTQAVFNLVQNASEAMMDQGSGHVLVSAAYHDDMIELAVSDDGPGMSEAVRRRCVEPFFTTKVRSISTGLGLALARGVVMRAGGTIGVVSEVGAGTTWTMSFPVAKYSEMRTSNGEQLRATVALEDPRVAAFVATMLRSLDFDVVDVTACPSSGRPIDAAVLVTDDPDEALAHVDEHPSRNAVVLNVEAPPQHPRILHTGGQTTSGAIRRVLRDLVQVRDGILKNENESVRK